MLKMLQVRIQNKEATDVRNWKITVLIDWSYCLTDKNTILQILNLAH